MNKLERSKPRGRRWRGVALTVCSAWVLVACGGGTPAPEKAGSTAASPQERAQVLSAPPAAQAALRADPAVDLKVTGLLKVSEVRVGRTDFDFTFKITVQNQAAVAFEQVKLTLTAVGSGASIIDGSVVVGTIASNASVVPTDTVTIRQNRTLPFDAAALVWRIEGTPVDTPAAQLAALEASGAIPTLERGSLLQGVDANGNGVRDDIDSYIQTQYAAAAQRAAAVQVARALQRAVLLSPATTESAKAASITVSNAVNCVFVRFPGGASSKDPARVVKELEGVTANTKPRLLAYLAYNKLLDGTSSALPEGDTCE